MDLRLKKLFNSYTFYNKCNIILTNVQTTFYCCQQLFHYTSSFIKYMYLL